MNQSPQHLIKLLEKNGFIFKRSKGSHPVFYDVKKGTFLAILKQAGIDKNDI